MQTIISTLPSDQQFPAKMVVSGTVEFHNIHPLVQLFATARGMSNTDVDALWAHASTL